MENIWLQRYKVVLNERISIKDIMLLEDVGQPTASMIRNEAVKYCVKNNINIPSRKIPTEAYLAITHKDIQYYYDKMILEHKANTLYENN